MIFKNKDNQIRSGWKIVLACLLFSLIIITINIIIGVIIGIVYAYKGTNDLSSVGNFLSGDLGMLISSLLNNGGFIITSILLWKLLDKKNIKDMGITNIKNGKKELLTGLIMGAVSITVVCIALLLLKQVKLTNSISSPNISVSPVIGLITFTLVGFGEEIFGRAYVMSVLKQTKNKWAIIIISSAIFSALHLFNNSIGILPVINLFIVGVLFGYMFMKSRNVWMPIGFHITWNYFQGYIWGFQVSGNEVKGLYQVEIVANNYINGGQFGPEGGLVVTFILLILFAIVGVYFKDKEIDNFLYEEEVGIIKYN